MILVSFLSRDPLFPISSLTIFNNLIFLHIEDEGGMLFFGALEYSDKLRYEALLCDLDSLHWGIELGEVATLTINWPVDYFYHWDA